MTNEYRIKEVRVGFTADNISTLYYPQVLNKRTKVPKWKFWIKEPVIEKWDIFYREGEKVRTSPETISPLLPASFIIAFMDIAGAQDWIKDYDRKKKMELQKFRDDMIKKVGLGMAADKIHPVTDPAGIPLGPFYSSVPRQDSVEVHLINDIFAVLVPEKTVSAEIYDKESLPLAVMAYVNDPKGHFKPGTPVPVFPLSDGEWEYMCLANKITEFMAKKIVDEVPAWPIPLYNNYCATGRDFRDIVEAAFTNATESFSSLLLSKNLAKGNYAIIKKLK